jgi:DNA-3-methyladenine glycosylase II
MTTASEIINHFKIADPIIFPFIQAVQAELQLEKERPQLYFYRLCRAIAGQQLSVKAAATIWGRVADLIKADENILPQQLLDIPVEKLRECGLSNAKANYMHNIAQAFRDDASYTNLEHLSDEEVIELLTKIKGVGRWTAEMFLMFTLGREDIFSPGDLGLIKGMMQIYGLKKKPSPTKIKQITSKWKPYRTFASLMLWSVFDNKPK